MLFAHQGGWDETLMFLVPIVLAFFVIRRLERRGQAAAEDQAQEESESQNTTP
ncbi:MAG: hypothetical protein GY926_02570 [bacterium]|nr:hypothetical protein [bacterium]MCP4964099.1 hypothetical protein [bacterium]